ncbi:hypothetical protein O206_22520 [Ochrobactrum sp. EGD-AQ16]|nr:hypothetical protein O206_22520 [Ochrobactrum sp. EGD-AQ16]
MLSSLIRKELAFVPRTNIVSLIADAPAEVPAIIPPHLQISFIWP